MPALTVAYADPARMAGLVDEAVAKGASALRPEGALPGAGHYTAPTVLLDAPVDCRAVCGTDLDEARAVAGQLRAGIVGVNTGTPNTPWVPFGGQGESGLGYEGGRPGLEAFQNFQSVACRSTES